MRLKRALLMGASLGAFAMAACTGSIGDPEDEDVDGRGPEAGPAALAPPAPTLRRLLERQYRNAVRDLLGDAAAAAASPPDDTAINGFDAIGSAQLAVGDTAVVRYEASARAVAAAAMGDSARIEAIAGCVPTGVEDAACRRQFVERFGRLVFRRPLAADEIERVAGVADLASAELGDAYAGIEHAIATLLQSPSFLYMVEVGEPLGGGSALRRLNGHEMASRMSFFLLDTTPDLALLDAADSGTLDTDEGVRAAAEELISRPGARSALRSFYGEFLRLRNLDRIVKDASTFDRFTPSLAQAMREETLRLIDDVVWERDADYREVIDADFTFVNPELAALYGVEPPVSGGWERVNLPAEQRRAGLLGQASFLSLFAHAASTSPTLRGRFVREALLCESIPAPPNNVVTELPDDTEARTMREKLAAHQTIPSCAACHVLMDNIGFALENFDGIGAYRATENGATIDATGEIQGIGSFDGEAELSRLLSASPKVMECVVKNLFRYATGHVETRGELGAISGLAAGFEGSGYRMKDLLVELVASESFRYVGELL